MDSVPAMTAARSSARRATGGHRPLEGSTVKTSTATPSSPATTAERTLSPWSARYAGDLGQQPRSIGRHHGDDRVVDGQGRHPVRPNGVHDRPQLVGDPRGGRGERLAGQQPAGPLDQVGHQSGLPRPPRRRPGGQTVGLDQRGQQIEHGPAPDLVGHLFGGGRVVEVPAGGAVGQQKVQTDHGDQGVDVLGREPHAGGDVGGDGHADLGVVPGKALPDVVEQGSDQQEVGPADPVGQGGGVGGRLQEVPVDGEAVVRISLGLVAHRRPLGEVVARAICAGRAPPGRRWPGGRWPVPGPGSTEGRPARARAAAAPSCPAD